MKLSITFQLIKIEFERLLNIGSLQEKDNGDREDTITTPNESPPGLKEK